MGIFSETGSQRTPSVCTHGVGSVVSKLALEGSCRDRFRWQRGAVGAQLTYPRRVAERPTIGLKHRTGTHMPTPRSDGVASTTRTMFSRCTRIAQHIDSDPAAVWRLLTTAADYPRWNSTVVSLDGQITLGSKIKLVSTLVPSRTFRLKVKEFEPNARLTFGDAMSTRTYSLSGDAGGTRVEVVERIGGPFFPFLAPMIPPFDENFEQFTADLKKAAEAAAT